MLEVSALSASYGSHPALQDVALNVGIGEIVVMLGANGAGKSTLLRCISGICEGSVQGDIRINGQSLMGSSPDQIVEKGISLVPEGRGVFADMSVKENLLLGAHPTRARESETNSLQQVLTLFPRLAERQSQEVRTMSGGEQQMVAIGRALMSNPEILLLDEPSLGLSPLLCKELFKNLSNVRDTGIGILLVEQNARQSLAIADRGYLMENTRIVHEDTASRLINDPAVQKAYLGGAAQATKTIEPTMPEKESDTVSTVTRPDFIPMHRPRKSAEQVAGISIEQIVADAATASTAYNPSTSVAESSENKPTGLTIGLNGSSETHDSRLRNAVKAIEDAARLARQRTTKRHSSARAPVKALSPSTTRSHEGSIAEPHRHTSKGVHPLPDNQERPVVIEVYRPPRVEVYRRRPGGTKLERE